MEFSDIVLTKDELKALKRIYKEKIAEPDIDKAVSDRLYREEFIDVKLFDGEKARSENLSSDDFYWRITDKGRDYLLYTLAKKSERSIDHRHFWITTMIAVVALIKSFLPQIKQIIELISSII